MAFVNGHARRDDHGTDDGAPPVIQLADRKVGPDDADRRAEALSHVDRARVLAERQLEKLLGIPVADLARIAQQAELYLSTIRSFVEAVGGDLVLAVRLPWNGEVAMSPGTVLRPLPSHQPQPQPQV